MAADTPLWEAHDLSQQLQDKIEVLPRVERAFVHVDHETTHTPVRTALVTPLLYLLICAVPRYLCRNTGKLCDEVFLFLG